MHLRPIKNPIFKWSALVGVIALAGTAGCVDRNNDGTPESAPTNEEVNQAVERTGNAAEDAVETAADVSQNAAITGKINAAYAADSSLSALAINVDTTENNKTVTLSGTVATADQKLLASKIAKDQAPGYKVVNNLKTG